MFTQPRSWPSSQVSITCCFLVSMSDVDSEWLVDLCKTQKLKEANKGKAEFETWPRGLWCKCVGILSATVASWIKPGYTRVCCDFKLSGGNWGGWWRMHETWWMMDNKIWKAFAQNLDKSTYRLYRDPFGCGHWQTNWFLMFIPQFQSWVDSHWIFNGYN